jgi:hypothetical protein
MAKSTRKNTKSTTKRKNTMRSKHTRKQKQTRKSNLKGGEPPNKKLAGTRTNILNRNKRKGKGKCSEGEDLSIDNLNNNNGHLLVHEETDRKKAEALLTNDNTFLIRKSNNPTDSLTLVKKDNEGESDKIKICKINNKLYIIKKDGTKDEYDNLQDLIKRYKLTYGYKFVQPEDKIYASVKKLQPPVVNRSTKPQTITGQPIYVPATNAIQTNQLYNPVTKTVYGPNPVYATHNRVQLPNPNYNHLIPRNSRSPTNKLPELPEPLVPAVLPPNHSLTVKRNQQLNQVYTVPNPVNLT